MTSLSVKEQKKPETAEFSLNMLLQVAVIITVIAIVVIVGIDLVSSTGKDICEDAGYYYGSDGKCFNNATMNIAQDVDENATQQSLSALGTVTSKLGTVVTAIVGIVIIGIIIRLLGGFIRGGEMGGSAGGGGFKLQ